MRTEEQLQTARKQKSLGLVANGFAGLWQVAVDETLEGAQQWFAQIEGPSCYLYFEISHAKVMAEILEFFEGHLQRDRAKPQPSANGDLELKLGRRGGNSIELLWDRDAADRCFMLLRGDNELCVRVALFQADLEALAAALQQVRDALYEDGVISEPE